ncbi:hypothetical protein ACET9F_15890, partial [Aeromonas veronii]
KKSAQTGKNEMTESAEKNFPAYSHLPKVLSGEINSSRSYFPENTDTVNVAGFCIVSVYFSPSSLTRNPPC